MQLTSDRFQQAVRESGTRLAVADLYYNRGKVPVVTDLPIISGSITVDSTSAMRRSGTITLASTDLLTPNLQASLAPYGFEIGVRIGVQYPDGSQELVPYGIFVITDLNFNEEEGNIPTCTLADRSQFIAEQSSKTGVEDYSGKSTFFAIQDLMTKSIFINVTQHTDPVDPSDLTPDQLALVVDTANLTDITIPGGSPMDGGSFWDDCQLLAQSLGAELFFDPDGSNVWLQKVPDITTDTTAEDADLSVDVGVNGTLMTSATGLSRIGAYNAVQITGTATSDTTAAAPTAFVYDTDPGSPTFYDMTGGTDSGFGRIVKVVSSDTLTAVADLKAAATTILKQGVGLAKSLAFSMLPNPALDCGDVVALHHLDGSTDVAMVTQIVYDITSGSPMSVTTKAPNAILTVDTGTGVPPDGPSPKPPPKPTPASHTKTYNATWSQAYLPNGNQTNGSNSHWCYQGNAADGQGNRMSLIGFNYAAIQSDLSGKTIESCTLTLYYDHWWYSSGTAVIGTHNSTGTPPTSYPSTNVGRLKSSGWPNPGKRTVNLGTGIGKEFRDGTTKGVAIGGPGTSSSKTYYGYASGPGAKNPPVLTIVYH